MTSTRSPRRAYTATEKARRTEESYYHGVVPGKRNTAGRDERRAQLVAAAQTVFAAKGYHAATVDDITRAANVAKGTFYLYFEEKREIFYEVIRGFFHLIKDIGRSVGETASSGAGFVEQAERAAHELMRVFLENRELARLAYRDSMGLDPELERQVRGFYREIAEVEAQNIRLGIELGLFRAVDPVLVAYAHIGMIERVLLQLLDDASALPPPERIVKDMIGLALEGLLARPA
jgi:AcrR family transcriptional regulator